MRLIESINKKIFKTIIEEKKTINDFKDCLIENEDCTRLNLAIQYCDYLLEKIN